MDTAIDFVLKQSIDHWYGRSKKAICRHTQQLLTLLPVGEHLASLRESARVSTRDHKLFEFEFTVTRENIAHAEVGTIWMIKC